MAQVFRVLVVEDDEVDRLAVRRALSRSGVAVEITEAHDGPSGITALANGAFDCAFLDFSLPPLDGLEILREVHELGVQTPVVVLTGQGDERLAAEVLRLGASDYLTKAELTPETVARSLRHAIRSHEQESELRRLASFPEECPTPIVEVEGNGTITYCNPAATSAFPTLREDRAKHPLMAGWDLTRAALTEEDLSVTREMEIGGACYHVTVSRAEAHCFRIWAVDITERRLAEQQLRHSAFYDMLTDLPNRALFVDRLERSIERAKRRADARFAVLFLDLDRFKVVNDSLGHHRGDKLLVSAAQRLTCCVRAEDTVARFGGDEFAILLENPEDVQEVTRIADRILADFKVPFQLDDRQVYSSTSIGIALSHGGADHSADDFLRDADTAMYRAKEQGGSRFQVFDRGMHDHAIGMLQLETELRAALEGGQMRILFQPVVALESSAVAGLEALLRWQHPTRGLLAPEDFLDLAEETGIIVEVDRWVLRESCRHLADWRTRLGDKAPDFVSVNLSRRQFSDQKLIEVVEKTLVEAGLTGKRSGLEVEFTESAIIDDFDRSVETLARLRSLGVRVAMDDFGTGYSSLGYLRRLPIDTLKIDRSIIADASGEGPDFEIVRAVIGLASRFGFRVIAEGVESEAQWLLVKELGCDLAQGFWFAPPMIAAEVEAVIEQGQIIRES